jgi:large subunit ribosomal protein L19e
MNLKNNRELAARTLGVGKKRIIFNSNSLAEIKEAITKQDILTLVEEGIISLKPVSGRRKLEKRKTKRGLGKIKKKIKRRKQNYVKITRKLRRYLKDLKNAGKIEDESYRDVRKKIKMSMFRSKAHLKEYLENPTQSKSEKEKNKIEEIHAKESKIKEKKKPGRKSGAKSE